MCASSSSAARARPSAPAPIIDWMRRGGERTELGNETDALELARMLRHLHDLPQITVALVHGAAMGGGAGLAAACDIAVAVKDARFCFSEVRLGLIPATIAPYVVEAIGPRWAKALFTTRESCSTATSPRRLASSNMRWTTKAL